MPWGSLSEGRYLVLLSRTTNYPPSFFPFSQATTSHTWSFASFCLFDPTALRLHLSLSLFYPVRPVLSRAQKTVIRPALPTSASLNCILSHPGKLPEPPLQPPSSTCLGRLFRTLCSGLARSAVSGYALRQKRLDSWMVDLMFIACHPSLSALSTCRQIRQH